MFLDKRAVYNKNITGGGVPWEEEGKPFFKFGIRGNDLLNIRCGRYLMQNGHIRTLPAVSGIM